MELRNLYPATSSRKSHVFQNHHCSHHTASCSDGEESQFHYEGNTHHHQIIILEVQLTPTCSAREALHLPTESTDISSSTGRVNERVTI